MKLLLMPNLKKKDSMACTNRVVEILLALGATPMLENRMKSLVAQVTGIEFGTREELLERCDVLVAIGGDGTMLHRAQYAAEADKPIIGINTGRVGFLTQMENHAMDDGLAMLVNGSYHIENRMLLDVILDGSGEKPSFTALNEVIVTRSTHRIAEMNVYSGEKLIIHQRADGLIFATPTGSTAYSLSAGGAVVDPSISVILMTAICPYSTFNRSLVLPPDCIYTVHPQGGSVVQILADGEHLGEIRQGQTIKICKSSRSARFVALGIQDFYSSMREKLV